MWWLMNPKATPNDHAERVLDRLLTALRAAMAPRGVKWFAGEIGLRHDTLLHKTDPSNPADMLTLRQFLRLVVRVDAGAVMRPVAAELGGQWITVPSPERIGADLHRLMTEASREFGRVANVLIAATDPDSPGGSDWTDEELDALEREADAANDKLHLIVAAARRRKAGAPVSLVKRALVKR
jgi:hypothetical protein